MSTKITLEDRLFTLEEVVFLMSEAVEQPEKNEYDIVDFFFLKKYKKQQEALMAKERAKNYMRLKDGYKEKTTNYTAVEWLVANIDWQLLKNTTTHYKMIVEKAKEIEKKQQWKTVLEEIPPSNIELLVQSPEGINHLASWREGYSIFTCQEKSETSSHWKWKLI